MFFGGIPGPASSNNNNNSGLPKKSYSVTSWKPGNTLRTATTAGSNNAYLWNMPSSGSAAAAAKEDETKKSPENTPKTASNSARDNVFRDKEEEEEDDDDDDPDDDYSLIPTKIPTTESPTWELGNHFDQFLNQCAIQSFLFLLKTCRDPQTVLWLEAFTQPAITHSRNRLAQQERQTLHLGGSANSKLLSYHGLAAMNTTAFASWDAYFRQLLDQPVEHQTVESWQAHIPAYDLEINPASLCTRLLSVREQVAREFARDLSVLASSPKEQEGRIITGSGATLLFLEPFEDGESAPSPLRKGNFDLLVLLVTQESIHRVLMMANTGTTPANIVTVDNEEDDECPVTILSRSNRNFLSNFYLQRLVSHFTGRQPYGRADQFLQELLASAPSSTMIVDSNNDDDNNDDDDPCRVDPTQIAQHILDMRHVVAREWKAEAERVPESHTDLKRLQLDRLLESYNQSNNSSNDDDNETPFQ